MDLVFLMALPPVLWLQAWHLLGAYDSPRTLGITAGAVSIVLLGIVLFQDKLPMVIEAPADLGQFLTPSTALSGFILAWLVYTVIVAGVYLWGLDSRAMGFYSLLLWVVSSFYAIYFFLGNRILDGGEVVEYTWLMGVVAVMLGVLAALQFFYLVLQPRGLGEPTSSPFRTVTAWFFLLFSVSIAGMGGLMLLGLNPML